jgi:autotransporter passenger strand-loop-strand repeat protein
MLVLTAPAISWMGCVFGTASGDIVRRGSQIVSSGGSAVATTVSSGGLENVSSGGTAINTIVSSGGSLVVLSRGLADPTTIYSGGSETVSSGRTDLGTHLSGGTLVILRKARGLPRYLSLKEHLALGINIAWFPGFTHHVMWAALWDFMTAPSAKIAAIVDFPEARSPKRMTKPCSRRAFRASR